MKIEKSKAFLALLLSSLVMGGGWVEKLLPQKSAISQ